LNFGPTAEPIPSLTLRDSAGNRFLLEELQGRVWVASVISRRCLEQCPESLTRLAELYDDLPPGVPLVTAVIDTRGRWPQRPKLTGSRKDWVFCQGNPVDADDESKIRELAVNRLGFAADSLEELRAGTTDVLVTLVDRGGRHRSSASLPASGAWNRPLSRVLGDAEFLASLSRRPLLDAGLNGLSAALLVAGLLLIRRHQNARLHSICTLLATTTTLVFLGTSFLHLYHVGSMPFRGAGWSRPLYFGIVSTHAVLSALAVSLSAALVYHAVRRSFPTHRAIARWALPAWVCVSLTGGLVYCMLHLWVLDS